MDSKLWPGWGLYPLSTISEGHIICTCLSSPLTFILRLYSTYSCTLYWDCVLTVERLTRAEIKLKSRRVVSLSIRNQQYIRLVIGLGCSETLSVIFGLELKLSSEVVSNQSSFELLTLIWWAAFTGEARVQSYRKQMEAGGGCSQLSVIFDLQLNFWDAFSSKPITDGKLCMPF